MLATPSTARTIKKKRNKFCSPHAKLSTASSGESFFRKKEIARVLPARERVTPLSLQATGQRTGSVHLAEELCSIYHFKPIKHYEASAQARGTSEGWRVGARCVVRGHTTQTVFKKRGKTSARPCSALGNLLLRVVSPYIANVSLTCC